MIKVFDYKCPNGHVHEVFTESSEVTVLCKTCGEVARYIPSAMNFALDGSDMAFPTAAMKWDKRHSKEAVEKIMAKKQG